VEIAVAGGAVIDLASTQDLRQHHDRIVDALKRGPFAHFQRLAGSEESGAGPLLIDLGTPPSGMIWLPQWVNVFGADAFMGASNASIANVSAAVFAGSLPLEAALKIGPPVTGPAWSDVIVPGILVPSSFSMPDKSPVFPNEHLYVLFGGSGLAAGSTGQYWATAGVLEGPFSDEFLSSL
jgi:hypothetical protein